MWLDFYINFRSQKYTVSTTQHCETCSYQNSINVRKALLTPASPGWLFDRSRVFFKAHSEFKTNKSDLNRSHLPLCCDVSMTSLYIRYLLSFGKLSYWSLLRPQRWQCWTSASGRSMPASRLVQLSFYPDQQELRFLQHEETEQEYLTEMMLAPPFGHLYELK